MENQNNSHKRKATDGFSTTEKIKAVIPGTAEHRAKKAAQERINVDKQHGDKLDQPVVMEKKEEPMQTEASTGEKLKAVIPGTEEHRMKDNLKSQKMEDFHHEPKATDGFTTGEKLKADLPGTAEHRAKQAAQDRLDGQLPHSVIEELGKPPVSKVE